MAELTAPPQATSTAPGEPDQQDPGTAGRALREPRRQGPSGALRWGLRALVVTYLFLLVAWPCYLVVQHTFDGGLDAVTTVLQDPEVQHALKLTVLVAGVAVVINTVFGVVMALLLVRHEFPGKRLLNALVDLPLSVSPIVVGLSLVLVYNGVDGWFGPTLESWGFQVIFATPGLIMATAFVALPLVIREVTPVLREIGTEQEQAARSLGANGWQVFRRITLPGIKWALVYGVVLTLARSLGEFGAVKVVSGNVSGTTETATLLVEKNYQNFNQQGAYTVAFLLAMVSVVCIVVVALLRPKEGKR